MAAQLAAATRNAMMDAFTTNLGNNGYLRIYSGTRPANVAAAITGTLLAELRFNASASFGASSGGVITAGAITADSSADATGTATHSRWFKSDGTTAVLDCNVAASASDINLSSVSIVATGNVSISSLTVTDGNA
jgi:hypothetical protein